MNCNEVKELLMPFHDGELDPAMAAEVEAALVGCPECQSELAELSLIHAFAADAFTATAPEVDLSGVYDGVMARIAVEDAETAASPAMIEGVRVQREDAGPGLVERIGAWFNELFRLQRPLTALAAAAAVIALVAGVWFTGSQSNTGGDKVDGGDGFATIDNGAKRRGREGEVAVKNARVEAIASKGEVKVITFDDSDDEPLVLWHVVEGEGVSMPDGNSNGTKGL